MSNPRRPRTGPWPQLPYDPTDPRQLRLFDDGLDDQRELLADIKALILEMKRHYHPRKARSACSTAMLLSILRGLRAEALSVAA